MNKDVIIALDFNNLEDLNTFLDKFDEPLFLKVGLELYCSFGNEIVNNLKSKNHKVFLDLKLHDIPNTVASTIKTLNKMDVDIITIHAKGGYKMMNEAAKVINEKTHLIAVTELTSTSQEEYEKTNSVQKKVQESVIDLSKLALEAGCDGVVSSGLEVKKIKEISNDKLLTITPGIRSNKQDAQDQARVITPLEAHQLNTDYIVVGREITNSQKPYETYKKIKKAFIKGEKWI